MGLSVNTNIAAMNAYRNLSVTDGQMSKSLEKLSSGFRINRAADDAAGLAISEGLRSQIGGLKVAARNAQDGISVVQTAEGALTEVTSMLQRMNDLTVQYNNGTQNTDSKAAIKSEYEQLKTEIGRIQTNTKFNGVSLFGATAATAANVNTAAAAGSAGVLSFQVGYASTDKIDVDLSKFISVTGLDIDGAADDGVGGTTSNDVQAAITLTSALRANLGALQNRFEHTINNLNTSVENLSAAESRIRDTDMAQEMTNFSRTQILSQAGTAMLAQANQGSQGILKLLG
ncbi:flagellin [Geodermatophilus sp. SYSU D01186]